MATITRRCSAVQVSLLLSCRRVSTCLVRGAKPRPLLKYSSHHVTYHTSRLVCSNEPPRSGNGEDAAGTAPPGEKDILESSLSFVSQYGWTPEAISEGAKALNLSGAVHGVFSRGGYDLVQYFELKSNAELVAFMTQLRKSADSVTPGEGEGEARQKKISQPEFIRRSLEHRLRMLAPYLHHWPQAMALKANPLWACSSLSQLSHMVDDVWYHAGDRSTDTNWYTKRGLLAGVYCSTELHMVQDTSEDFLETWSFLERRLNDVKDVGIAGREFVNAINSFGNVANVSLKTVANVLGWRMK